MPKKIAFFDMDGTLVAPKFFDGERDYRSFPAEEWIRFCQEHGKDTYRHCMPLLPVFEFARLLRDKGGYELRIATVIMSNEEAQAKIKLKDEDELFRIFEAMNLVCDNDGKIVLLEQVAKEIGPENVLLVDDDFHNVIRANQLGVKGLHVSHAIDIIWQRMAGEGRIL